MALTTSGRHSGLSFDLELPPLDSSSTGASSSSGSTASTRTREMEGGTSNVPTGVGVTHGADASEIANKARNQYTEPQRKQDLEEHRANQDVITDNFALSPEQWFKMYNYWNWDLAKNNPVGNLNNRSFNKTLYQSRLADALNNQRHWSAAKIGRRTNSSFGTNELQEGSSERWEPIETQETRQMRANEHLDELTRQRQINRSENIQDYPLELQKNADSLKQQLANYQAQTGIDLNRLVQKSIIDQEYSQSFQTYWQNLTTRFAKELDLNIKDRIVQKAMNMQYPWSQLYAYVQAGVQVPSELSAATEEYINQYVASFPPEQQYKARILITGMANTMFATGAWRAGTDTFKNMFGIGGN